MKILIVGPYGGCNIGDDLILEQILGELGKFHCDVFVSCANPDAVASLFDVKTIPLLEFRKFENDVLKLIPKMDAVIIGGGEQLSEPRIPNPIWGHLATSAHICRVSIRHRIPIMLWAVGLDSLRSWISKYLVRTWILRNEVVCTFRDHKSVERAELLAKTGFTGISRVADPAFLLESVDRVTARDFLFSRLQVPPNRSPIALLVPANDKKISLEYLSNYAILARELIAKGWNVFGWVTDLQKDYDVAISVDPIWEEIEGFCWLPIEYLDSHQMSQIIAASDLVVSARMHPLIVAATQNVNCIGLARSAKMDAIAAELDIASVDIREFDQTYVSDIIESINAPNSDLSRSKVRPCSEEKIRQMREIAKSTCDIFAEKIYMPQAAAATSNHR